MKTELSAIATIAFRDLLKLLRDRGRLLATFIFPLIFIGVLGGSLQANLSSDVGYNFLAFVFSGVLGQTLFQSTAAGLISLIEDRENDFSQEIFVAPVSRYSIVLGKILGEGLVALVQGVGIIAFGLTIGMPFSLEIFLRMLPAALLVCLFGGAFGLFVLSLLGSQRSANQIFPFIIFPQFFLAGVFSPIRVLPLPLFILSRVAPMTYAVDILRIAYYWGLPESSKVVLHPLPINLAVISVFTIAFIVIGTWRFVNNERNR